MDVRLLVGLGLVVTIAGCAVPVGSAPVREPPATEAPPALATPGPPSVDGNARPTRTPFATPPAEVAPSAQVPMPQVTLMKNAFTVGAAPPLRRVAVTDLPEAVLWPWALGLLQRLDSFRGVGPIARVKGPGSPASDEEWNSLVWPGPFQQVARAAVVAKPPAGRFFHLESARVDAVYALPWSGLQFADATIVFRDHADVPPAEGELWYTWHVRLPTAGSQIFAIADGHDASTRSFMRSEPYWTRAGLEAEAVSAVAGYLWNESYVPGGSQQFSNARDTTPFWRERIAALNELNALFAAGTLTSRTFEDVRVRIEAFEPLTLFGGGIVTATMTGRLVEVVSGKTITETFTQPVKFFRFGASGAGISGWAAVDAFQDGEWVSGGSLALDKLETAHG